MFYCMVEEVEGVHQAAVVPFGWQFESGVMRARVNPADGQVWVIGQRGWDTRAKLDGSVNRIRYTGQAGNLVTGCGVTPGGAAAVQGASGKERRVGCESLQSRAVELPVVGELWFCPLPSSDGRGGGRTSGGW